MSTMTQRHEAITATIGRITAIETSQGVTPDALAAIKTELVALATREDLFPGEEFHAPEKGALYRLAEDADHRFALYAVTCVKSRSSPVHNHTTWAAIAGVRGRERNTIYERTDNRDTPGVGRLRQVGEHTVVSGTAVAYMPDDFHAIEMVGDGPWVQLHLYGRSLEHLPGRIKFEGPEGGAFAVYPANPTIGTLELSAETVKGFIADGEELALLDVREEAAFSEGHLLLASNPAHQPAGGRGAAAGAAPHDPGDRDRRPRARAWRSTRHGGCSTSAGRTSPCCMAASPAGGMRATSCSAASTCPARRSARWSSTPTTRRISRRRR